MTFLQGLNEYFFIISFTFTLILIIGFIKGARSGGTVRHLPYMLSLFVLTVYCLITPVFFYSKGLTSIIGTDISHYYGAGLFFNMLGALTFIVGYWISARSKSRWEEPAANELRNANKPITILFFVFYIISFLNLAAGGVSLQRVVTGDAVVGLGARGATYYLQNFTDSLISVIIIAYIYGLPKGRILLFIGLSFFLFSLLGFRYRIILTLLGLLTVYLYKHKVSIKQLVGAIVLGLVFFYGIMVSTVNRWVLVTRQYDQLELSPLAFDYSVFFDQTRGALADMAVYRHFDIPGRGAEHDNGITMFGYVFIRIIPRSIMPDKDRFYPPPQLATTIAAYDAWWARFSGEATLNLAAFYIAFGWMGIVLGCFFWGFLLRKFGDRIRKRDALSYAVYIIITLVSFQWITRGYMPQIIDQAIYMLVPVWILRYIAKKNPAKK